MSQHPKGRYTLDECYAALDVHPKTFRRWLEQAKMTPERSRADERIKFLTSEQVAQLARLHDRPWPPLVRPQPEVIRPEAYKLLVDQLAEAEQQVRQIRTEHTQLQGAITELAQQREATVCQLAAIEQAQREQAEQVKALTSRLDSVTTIVAQQAERLDAQDEQAKAIVARLGTLTTESSQQAQQIAQLIGRLDMQGQQIAQLTGDLAGLSQQVKEAQEAIRQQSEAVEQRLHAAFQTALTVLRREMQEEFERRAQGIEAEQARDVATLTEQQERQGEQLTRLTERLKGIATAAEEAKTTATSSQRQSASAEQAIKHLQQQLQVEQRARTNLEAVVKQLLEAQKPEGQPRAYKPRGGGKPKSSSAPTGPQM